MKPRPTEKQIEDREDEMFQDTVFYEDILVAWKRGQYSDAELIDKLKYIKSQAETNAEEAIEQERADSFEREAM